MPSPKPTPGKVTSAELATPEVKRSTTVALTVGFALFIAGVPLQQALHEVRAGTPIRALDLLRDPPRLADFDFLDKGNPLHVFEHSLVDASVPRQAAQQRLQSLLTGVLGYGNNSVVYGHDGWLFYRPTIDYLSARGSQSNHIASTRDGVSTGGPEALMAAVLRFQEDCKAAGVDLIVMPVPEKEHFYPHHLTPFAVNDIPDDPNAAAFLAHLRTLGIEVFDPTPVMEKALAETPVFTPQETHWTPLAMDRVAEALAQQIRAHHELSEVTPWSAAPKSVTRLGDLVLSLQLPADQQLFTASPVELQQVANAEGQLWQSDPHAEVVLLGDSYTNIYSQADLGWGESSGLAPHLALHLAAPVDMIAVNAGGASGSRRQLASRPDPLSGKRVVVWEFGARNLTQDAWEVIPVKGKKAQAPSAAGLVLEAELLTRPGLPPPETLYPNARVFLKFKVRRVVSGSYSSGEVLVQLPVMANRVPTAVMRYRVGGLYQLNLADKVPPEWDGQPVVDDTAEYDLSPIWATQVTAMP